MSKETGGPAFPIWCETSVCASGMSIRDHFAGLALQGIIANQLMIDNTTDSAAEWAAKGAYKMADAMLKARSE